MWAHNRRPITTSNRAKNCEVASNLLDLLARTEGIKCRFRNSPLLLVFHLGMWILNWNPHAVRPIQIGFRGSTKSVPRANSPPKAS